MRKKIKQDNVTSYYQNTKIVDNYDCKRFSSPSGQYIDFIEKSAVKTFIGKPSYTNEIILDLASGTGRFTFLLTELGYKVIAVDYSLTMLKQIKQKSKKHNLNIICVRADINYLPFKNKSTLKANCTRFLWHYKNWKEMLKEIMRVTSGFVVFDVMNKKSLRYFITPIANRIVTHELVNETEVTNFCIENQFKISDKKFLFLFPYIFHLKLFFLSNIFQYIEKHFGSLKKYASIIFFKISH